MMFSMPHPYVTHCIQSVNICVDLAFPQFHLTINDNEAIFVTHTSIGPVPTKIHWSNLPPPSTCTVNVEPQPQPQPHHKPDPSHFHHKCITTDDLYQYLGYHTLNVKIFQSAIQDTINIVNMGEIP